jgi:predicted HTH domain antitoxin
LEMLALEGYRAGELSRGQVSEMLDLESNETERFLKEHGCGLGLSFEEYERDSKRLREFLGW